MIYFFQSLSLKVRMLAVILSLFPVLVFQWLLTQAPWALANLKAVSHGAGMPDQWFCYSPEALHQLFTLWGKAGRSVYWTILWPTDLGFLLSYGFFLTTTSLYLLKKANLAGPWWYFIPLVPLSASTADFLENAAVGAASLLPLGGGDGLAWVAATFSVMKWVLIGATIVVILVGTVCVWVRGLLRRLEP